MTSRPAVPECKTSPARLASARAWKERNKKRNAQYEKERSAAIRADPKLWVKKKEQNRKSRVKMLEQNREYDRQRDPIKLRARTMVRNRIWRGKLVRQPCEKCGDPKTHAHHSDYSKPLAVRWLCPLHHEEAHHG